MKSIYKLTPWILLAAIIIVLVISFFMNKSSGHIEGMTGRSLGSKMTIPEYYGNRPVLTPLYSNIIYFDELNGNLIFYEQAANENDTANETNKITIFDRFSGTETTSSDYIDTMTSIEAAITHTHHIKDEDGTLNYTIVYNAVGKQSNIYIFAYSSEDIIIDTNGHSAATKEHQYASEIVYAYDPSDVKKYIISIDKDNKTLSVEFIDYDSSTSTWPTNITLKGVTSISIIGSYAFAVDNVNCAPPTGSAECNQVNSSCESGIGYNDGNSYKCCSCTPQYAGQKSPFTNNNTLQQLLTVVDEGSKVAITSGTAILSKYDTDISLERIMNNAILFDKKMGNLVIINSPATSSENDPNLVPSIMSYKNEEVKNMEELTKTDTMYSYFYYYQPLNAIILFTYYNTNINLSVIQLVISPNSQPKLELITSKHYLIETPNPISSTTNAIASSTSNSSSSNSTSNPAQDMGDSIYNRVSSKIGDVIEHELDKLLNPDASTDDRYILKTQVVPPVCPTCPNCVNNCKEGGVCSNCGGNGGSGTKTESGKSLAAEKKKSSNNIISDVVDETGDVAEQTVGAAGDLVTTTATATGDLVKTTAGTVVDVADSTVGGVARDLYSGTKGVAGDVYGATTGVAGDVYGTATGVVGDLYGGAKSLTTDLYGGIKSLGPDSVRGPGGQVSQGVTNTGSNIGVTQRTAYSNTGNQPSNIYNYYGALPNKETRYVPITTDFSAFGR